MLFQVNTEGVSVASQREQMGVTKPYRLAPSSQEPERETSVMRACRYAYLCV